MHRSDQHSDCCLINCIKSGKTSLWVKQIVSFLLCNGMPQKVGTKFWALEYVFLIVIDLDC